jgi:predicted nucleic acid-binding protein
VTYILDSWALMAWLKGESPGRQRVRVLLDKAALGRLELWMNMINVGEVFYLLVKLGREDQAQALIEDLGSAIPIRTLVPDSHGILEAARLKGRYSISYADAFAAATAIARDAPLVTGDAEFRVIAGLKLEWIGASVRHP